MGERIYERLIRCERGELSARVWIAADPAKWNKENNDDVGAALVVSGCLYCAGPASDQFLVADDIEAELKKVGFVVNAIEVSHKTKGVSALCYPEWP